MKFSDLEDKITPKPNQIAMKSIFLQVLRPHCSKRSVTWELIAVFCADRRLVPGYPLWHPSVIAIDRQVGSNYPVAKKQLLIVNTLKFEC